MMTETSDIIRWRSPFTTVVSRRENFSASF